MAEFAQKRANSAIATFAPSAKFYKVHICNIFARGKFYAHSFFCPVNVGYREVHHYFFHIGQISV